MSEENISEEFRWKKMDETRNYFIVCYYHVTYAFQSESV